MWFPGETVIAGIGQGYMLATPLQLAHATATLAMRGQRFEPRLVRGIRDARTGEVRELPPRPLPPVQVSDPTYWDVVIGGMVGVTNDPWGTARRSQRGRAVQDRRQDRHRAGVHGRPERDVQREATSPSACATTRCSSPSRRPTTRRSRSPCVVENGRSGSGTAAPIARKIFDAYLLPPEQAAAAGRTTTVEPAPAAGGTRNEGRKSQGQATRAARKRTLTVSGRLLAALHLDGPLLLAVLAVCAAGLVVLFSAAGEDLGVFLRQAARVGLGLARAGGRGAGAAARAARRRALAVRRRACCCWWRWRSSATSPWARSAGWTSASCASSPPRS